VHLHELAFRFRSCRCGGAPGRKYFIILERQDGRVWRGCDWPHPRMLSCTVTARERSFGDSVSRVALL